MSTRIRIFVFKSKLAAITFAAVIFMCISQTSATVIIMKPDMKLEELIRSAEPGDTIMVPAGTYRQGNITISKSIHLIGVDYPVLDGEFKHEVFTVTAPGVSIKGFRIINTGKSSMEDKAAIKCVNAQNIIIENNILDNSFFGIHLSHTDHAVIRCNVLTSVSEHEYEHGNGIHLWKCKNALIEGNEISGHRDGIYFEFVTQSHIFENISTHNIRYGLHFMFSNDDTYMFNAFRNNGAGVAVMYSTNVDMYQNEFEFNWGSSAYGMLLKDIRDSEVKCNIFKGNTIGIYMEGTSRTIFTQNIFRENGYALKLMASCDDNVFISNNFIYNTFDIATNGITVFNTIDGNYWDKYQGYDMNRDRIGDIPYRPVSIYSMILEQVPPAVMLWRSFLVYLLDKAEKVLPVVTPENLKDNSPLMHAHDYCS